MKDEIRVSSGMPGGNAFLLGVSGPRACPEVHFTPSPEGGPEAMWFFFRVQAAKKKKAPGRVRCVLHFPENMLGGGTKDFLPVFKAGADGWKRVPRLKASELPDGRLMFSWLVPLKEGKADVALCYPYGAEELEDLMGACDGRLRSDPIGITSGGNPIVRLCNGYGSPGSKRPGIYCLARQHSGETPGSWALDGFLRRMAAEGARAPLVWAVPFINPDGVAAGHYGKDSFPYDFNRAWGSSLFPESLHGCMGTHPMRHETKCVQKDMVRWSKRCAAALVIDFHAPGMCETSGIYCLLRKLDSRQKPDKAHRGWVRSFLSELGSELPARKFVRSGVYPSRWNTARAGDFASRAMKLPMVTFEIPYTRSHALVYRRENYIEAGSRIARAVIKQASRL